jgi:hypothetical protein
MGAAMNQSGIPIIIKSFVVERVKMPKRKQTAGKIVQARPIRPIQSNNKRIVSAA